MRARLIGSPHTDFGTVWPMSLLARGLTGADPEEIDKMVATLARLDVQSRFSWVNSLFGELGCKSVDKPLYQTTL